MAGDPHCPHFGGPDAPRSGHAGTGEDHPSRVSRLRGCHPSPLARNDASLFDDVGRCPRGPPIPEVPGISRPRKVARSARWPTTVAVWSPGIPEPVPAKARNGRTPHPFGQDNG
ncbi:hypothetical protein GCM10025780_31720 [Frondihabitans cladoniiphilus]|uniref:Uncharacterized protein n=1 Tax=Frondihabitans cladoniiphilus TaxID=715785 RepID=A0ABP8WAM0_9MICO